WLPLPRREPAHRHAGELQGPGVAAARPGGRGGRPARRGYAGRWLRGDRVQPGNGGEVMAPSLDRQTFREVLAGLAAKTLTKIPALNGRVEKACKLVLGGDVELHPDGTALVNSLTDPTRAYHVTGTPGQCPCKDFDQAPEHLCCHRLAVGFQRKVQE